MSWVGGEKAQVVEIVRTEDVDAGFGCLDRGVEVIPPALPRDLDGDTPEKTISSVTSETTLSGWPLRGISRLEAEEILQLLEDAFRLPLIEIVEDGVADPGLFP